MDGLTVNGQLLLLHCNQVQALIFTSKYVGKKNKARREMSAGQ